MPAAYIQVHFRLEFFICLFDLILYIPSTIFKLYWDGKVTQIFFFQNQLFQQNSFWNTIRMSGLIWVQTACKSYKQATLDDKELRKMFKRIIVIIFLITGLNMRCGFSKELFFQYPQHLFWLRNKKNNFQLHTLILG